MEIGEKIKLIRKANNLNQTEFAELSGVSVRSIKFYENSNRYPNKEQLKKMACVLPVGGVELLSVGDVNHLINILKKGMTLGERIKLIRVVNNLKQRELADLLKIDIRTIQYYERGDIVPKIKQLERLANVLPIGGDKISEPQNEYVKLQALKTQKGEMIFIPENTNFITRWNNQIQKPDFYVLEIVFPFKENGNVWHTNKQTLFEHYNDDFDNDIKLLHEEASLFDRKQIRTMMNDVLANAICQVNRDVKIIDINDIYKQSLECKGVIK